jgi:hypothetical protein
MASMDEIYLSVRHISCSSQWSSWENFPLSEELGDPVSTLLFVLATDFLQTILNNARANHHLSLPVALSSDEDFPILQYAEDTLIFMKGDLNS